MFNDNIDDTNRLPVGFQSFSNLIESNLIYVDKTNLLFEIARQRSPIFFSRPRRFGKSLLVNTLSCLFSKGIEYFHGLDIEKKWHDKTYPVVALDFSTIANRKPDKFSLGLCKHIIKQFNKFCELSFNNDLNADDPADIFCDIAQDLDNNSVVLLIDEYDAPLIHHIENKGELLDITSILNDLYAAVKQYTDKFRLIFITGVTRASHVSIFSSFNNLIDVSFQNEFNELLGFTQNNLEQYFDADVENASKILNISKKDIYQRIKQYYDGFQFSIDANQRLYNPWSILNFLKFPQNGFKNYWFDSSGTSSIIMNYLKIKDSFNILNYQNRIIRKTIKELSAKFEITNIPYEILLYQTGFLTIRKESNQTVRLVFQNTEIEDSLLDFYFIANNIRLSEKVQHNIDELAENID